MTIPFVFAGLPRCISGQILETCVSFWKDQSVDGSTYRPSFRKPFVHEQTRSSRFKDHGRTRPIVAQSPRSSRFLSKWNTHRWLWRPGHKLIAKVCPGQRFPKCHHNGRSLGLLPSLHFTNPNIGGVYHFHHRWRSFVPFSSQLESSFYWQHIKGSRLRCRFGGFFLMA